VAAEARFPGQVWEATHTSGHRFAPTTVLLPSGALHGRVLDAAPLLAADGFTVAVLARDPAAAEAVAGAIGGIAVQADVLDADRVERVVETLVEDHGAIDVLVNNAGVGGTLAPLWEVDPDDWWHTLEVNVRGTHTVTRAVVPHMIARRRGRIVNVVSNAGVARWPLGSAYAVSKAAVIKHGENLAAEVRRHGVVVLNFHPGILEIGLTDTLFTAEPEPGTHAARVADWFRQQIAEGRSVDADVSAGQLARLAGGALDAFTGRYLTAYDDLDAIVAGAADLGDTDYTLGLLKP
jgi:NAD(P)-dependent dehydrogenase (short-subunit alcohol dehydrogenase family)